MEDERLVVDQHITDRFAIYNGDTVEVAESMPDHSVDFSVFSPPFESLYTYSASPRDLGNCRNSGEFWDQYRFLIQHSARVMKPGRLVAIHCMNLPTSKARDGHIGLRDFRGEIIREYQAAGFIYHSEVCIWKDPVTAMQRTKALGLLHKTIRKDAAMSRQGIPDYLVVMRAPGVNLEPITHHETGPGLLGCSPDASEEDVRRAVEVWQRYASPIWVTTRGVDSEGFAVCEGDTDPDDDSSTINPSDTLQHRSAREDNDERHIAPLQLEVIRRALLLWSNPGEWVWSPFAGIGSEGFVALREGRRFVGAELKRSYYEQAVRNLTEAAVERQLDLFGAA